MSKKKLERREGGGGGRGGRERGREAERHRIRTTEHLQTAEAECSLWMTPSCAWCSAQLNAC